MSNDTGEPAPNAKTLSITVKCLHCGHKFKSAVRMSPYAAFKVAFVSGNKQQCPSCGQMTACDKENFLATFEGGGWVGNQVL
jgi:hypothetical protein